MSTGTDHAIVGIFPTHERAMAAWNDLHRLGLADADVEIGTPAPGRYPVEDSEAADIGRGAMTGVVVGIPLGGVIGVAVLLAIVPGLMANGVQGIVLGLLMGAFWGIFFGGLAGVVPKVIAHSEGSRHCEIPEGGSETAVVAWALADAGAAHKIMRRHGATAFLSRVPEMHPVGAVAAPA